MKKQSAKDNQLALDIGEGALPADEAPKRTRRKTAAAGKPAVAKKPTKKPAKTPSPQATLPGLSRRGRPRSPNPVSPSVRALESRKRRVAAGGRRVEFLLDPEAAAQLDALVEHFKISRAEVIARLIGKAAKRLKAPD